MPKTVGVLALQGDFAEHERELARRGFATRRVRRPSELHGLDAIVLPGGESTTMLKLLRIQRLEEPLARALRDGLPALATCAGMILCATRVVEPEQRSFGVLDVDVARNGYGRQIRSGTFALETSPESGLPNPMHGIFIRAPKVLRTGPECEVLATRDGDPVLVRQRSILAACFHPELERGHPVYTMFDALVRGDDARIADSGALSELG